MLINCILQISYLTKLLDKDNIYMRLGRVAKRLIDGLKAQTPVAFSF
jgi:hypothetical protein